jgi:hypothetical protein
LAYEPLLDIWDATKVKLELLVFLQNDGTEKILVVEESVGSDVVAKGPP